MRLRPPGKPQRINMAFTQITENQMTNKVTVLRTKFFNMNLAEKMLVARENQQIAMERAMKDLSPRFQAIQDFNKGLDEGENPFEKDSDDWKEYENTWFNSYLVCLFAEQEELKCQ